MAELKFFNPCSDVRETANRLPHWQQSGAVYFVTFRLADSIPSHLLRDWNHEREAALNFHPQPWTEDVEREYHNTFSGELEQWLDAGHGSCILRRRECAEIVESTLAHFEGERVSRFSSVVMPNHVHVIFVQNPDYTLEKILRSWKSYTAREINAKIGLTGSLWQRDYFDRLIRDQHHFANCARYIRRNPAKAKLRHCEYILWESDEARKVQ